MKAREGRKPLKKKSIAFKANPTILEDEESKDEEEEEEEEEEFAMLVRKVGKLFY